MTTKKIYISTYEPINKLISLIERYANNNAAKFARKLGLSRQYMHLIIFDNKEVPESVSKLIKKNICPEIEVNELTPSINTKKVLDKSNK